MDRCWSISQQSLAIALSLIMLVPDGGFAAQSERKPTVKEQVLEIPAGSFIELRTIKKDKIRGRIGEATEASVAVRRVKDEKVETLTFSYQDIKSIKVTAESSGTGAKVGKTVAYVVLGGLATLGLLLLVVCAAAGCGG